MVVRQKPILQKLLFHIGCYQKRGGKAEWIQKQFGKQEFNDENISKDEGLYEEACIGFPVNDRAFVHDRLPG